MCNRYEEHGLKALCDRSRRQVCYDNQLPEPLNRQLCVSRRIISYWEANNIRELLVRRMTDDVRISAKRTRDLSSSIRVVTLRKTGAMAQSSSYAITSVGVRTDEADATARIIFWLF